MSKTALTDASLRALQAPAQGQITVWDKSSPLGVRVSQGGSKTFIVMTGSGKRETIGRFPILSLKKAREHAKERLAQKTLGIKQPAKTITFKEAKDLYLEECQAKNRPQTVSSYTRLLGHYPFASTRLAEIDGQEIARKLDKLTDRPAEYHHAIVAGRIFFRWCVNRLYVEHSPMEKLRPPKKGKPALKYRLTEEHYAAICRMALVGQTSFHRITALLCLCGQRRTETASIQWEWVKDDLVELPDWLTKNKKPHIFPLGKTAQAVIASVPRISDTYLFPAAREQVRGKPSTVVNGWGKPKAAFDKELKAAGHEIPPWTLHQLRKAYRTFHAKLGTPPHIAERLINHASAVASEVELVYDLYTYLPEMRTAVTRFDEEFGKLLKRS